MTMLLSTEHARVQFAYGQLTGRSDTIKTTTNTMKYPPFTRDVVGILTALQYRTTAEI
jgi:hypothetical protein